MYSAVLCISIPSPYSWFCRLTPSSSAFALAWRNYSPRSTLLQGSMSIFACHERWLGANLGYWPSDSIFDQGGGVHHKLLMFLTWMGYFVACHWHRHQVQSGKKRVFYSGEVAIFSWWCSVQSFIARPQIKHLSPYCKLYHTIKK
jgi:hypothetical protein